MVTDTCHVLTHPAPLPLAARVSLSQVRTLPAAFSKFILYLPVCPIPEGPQCVSHLHIPYSICPHPPASTYPYSPFFSRTLHGISHLSSCSIFQPDSFPLPVIPVDFDSSSTLNSNDPNSPISSTYNHLPALFPHLYKLV